MSGSCYKCEHYGALMKVSARLPEAREFIFMYDASKEAADNTERALKERWYGNASPRVCRELTSAFCDRFFPLPDHLSTLKRFLTLGGDAPLPVLNHFYMLLRDPYYRWAAADWMPGRRDMGLMTVPIETFEADARKILPDSLGPKTVTRYRQNILTALRDNGYLAGQTNKTIASPALPLPALAFMLYTLKELGEGFNDFDESPLFRALQKPRDLLVPLFKDGEKWRWWEFTGDRTRLSGNFTLSGLESLLQELGV